MSHSSEKTWPEVSLTVSRINKILLHLVAVNLEEFERIKEIRTYCDDDDTKFANLLFKNDKTLTTATTLEITQASELWDAVEMWEETNDFMNNVSVTTKDRAKLLRNVS